VNASDFLCGVIVRHSQALKKSSSVRDGNIPVQPIEDMGHASNGDRFCMLLAIRVW
jgi:hypothetical protein